MIVDINPLHLTPAQLQLIGAYAAPSIGFIAAAIISWIKRKRIISILLPRIILIAQRDAAESRALDALRVARTAEAASANQAASIDALKTIHDSLAKILADVQSKNLLLQTKVYAFVDWVHSLIRYITYLESKLSSNNLRKDQDMPKVPTLLSEQFSVPPETVPDD